MATGLGDWENFIQAVVESTINELIHLSITACNIGEFMFYRGEFLFVVLKFPFQFNAITFDSEYLIYLKEYNAPWTTDSTTFLGKLSPTNFAVSVAT